MHKKVLKVQVSDIKEFYPLHAILKETLSVNAADMTIIRDDDNKDEILKARQTARKSTNTKLRMQSPICSSRVSANVADESEPLSSSSAASCLPAQQSAEKPFPTNTSEDVSSVSTNVSNDILLNSSSNSCNQTSESNLGNGSTLPVPISTPVSVLSNDVSTQESIDSCTSGPTTSKCSEDVIIGVAASGKIAASGNCSSESNTETNNPLHLPKSCQEQSLLNGCLTKNELNLHGTIHKEQSHNVPAVKESQNNVAFSENGTSSDLKDASEKSCDNKPPNGKKAKTSIETVVQNLNLKQYHPKEDSDCETRSISHVKRSLHVNSADIIACKKPKVDVLNGITQTKLKTCKEEDATKFLPSVKEEKPAIEPETWRVTKVMPDIQKYVNEGVRKEVDLRIQLQKKSDEYNKLKEKYESVERNFHSWIEFANKLQARVKKIAYALHKQQDLAKFLQAKKVEKRSVEIQTDLSMAQLIQVPKPNNIGIAAPPSQLTPPSHKPPTCLASNKLLSRPKESPNASATTKVLQRTAKTSEVIDLTDEEEASAMAKLSASAVLMSSQKASAVSRIQPTPTVCGTSMHIISQPKAAAQAEIQKPILGVPSAHDLEAMRYLQKKAVCKTTVCLEGQRMVHQKAAASTRPTNTNNAMRGINNLPQMSRNPRPVLRIPNSIPLTSPPKRLAPRLPISQATLLQRHFTCVPKAQHQASAIVHHKNAPLPYPPLPVNSYSTAAPVPTRELLPPELLLGIKKNNGGIVLSWSNLKVNATSAKVIGYELYAYQENNNVAKREWRKIGDDTIAAMELPMACTLTQFTTGSIYYFAVRGKDIFGRFGPFSKPCSSRDIP